MSSIRLKYTSFINSEGDPYIYEKVDDGLFVRNTDNTKPATFNVRSAKDGQSDTSFIVFGSQNNDLTDAENLCINYNSVKSAYQIETSVLGNGASRPIYFQTYGNTEQIVLKTDGSVLFPQTTDSSTTQTGCVVFDGGVGVKRTLWSESLHTVQSVSVGDVLNVGSTLDSDSTGIGSAQFAGGIFAAKSLVLGNVIENKRIVLWTESGGPDGFIGFGVDTNGVGAAKSLRGQIPGISSQFSLFRGENGGSSSSEIFRISGDGTPKLFGSVNMNNFPIKSLADPIDAYDAVNKRYLDETINKFDPKESVQVATIYSTILATDVQSGQIIDDVALTAGMRVLVKSQTDPVENGVYIVQASGPPYRSGDMSTGSTVAGSFFFVESGTKYAHMGFMCSSINGSDVVGTDAVSFVQFSGTGQITGGQGILKQDNTISTSPDQSHVTRVGVIDVGEWQSSPVKVAYGGTGLTQVTVGQILYGNGVTGTALRSTPSLTFDETGLALSVGGSVYIGKPSSITPNFVAFRGLAGSGTVTNTNLTSVICERFSTSSQNSATELVIYKGPDSTGGTQDDIRVIAGGSVYFETLPVGATSSYNAVSDVFTGGGANQPVKRVSLNSTSFNVLDGVQLIVDDARNASSLSSAGTVLNGGLAVGLDILLGGSVRYTPSNIQTNCISNNFSIYNPDTSTADFHVSIQKQSTAGPRRVSLDVFSVGAFDSANNEGVTLLSDGIGGVNYLGVLQKGTGNVRPLVLLTGANTDQIRLEADGTVKFSSLINAINSTSAGAVFAGGVSIGFDARIGGKLYVASTLRAISTTEVHEITGSHVQPAVLVIANKNAAGNSAIGFDDSNGVRRLSIGYNTDGTGSSITSIGSLRLGSSVLVNTDGSVSLPGSLDSDVTTTNATLSLASGGLYVNKTITAGSVYAKSGGLTTVTSIDGIHHILQTTTKRWNISLAGGETGTNNGSNYTLSAYDDTGSSASTAVKIYRSDRHVEFYGTSGSTGVGTGALRLPGGIYSGSDSYFTGSLTLGGNLVSSGSLTTTSQIGTSSANLVFRNELGQTGWSIMMASGDTNSLQFRRHLTSTGALVDVPLIMRNDSKDIFLGGCSIYTSSSFNAPTLQARSIGTRGVLCADLASGRAEYAYGIGDNEFWTSVPTDVQMFGWYSGNQRVFQVSGSGQMGSRSGKSVYNVNSLDVGTQGVVFARYQSETDTGTGNVIDLTMTPTVSFTLTSQTTAPNAYSVVLPSTASTATGKYVGWYIKARTGSTASQVRKILAYNGATNIVQFASTSPWTTTRPGSGDIVDLYANCYGSTSFNSIRNEFLFTTSPTTALSEIEYCDLRANRVVCADGFIHVGFPHSADNLANRPKTAGDRGIVMKRWQIANDTSLGNVINQGTVDFADTLPSQVGYTTSQLALSVSASTTSDAYTNWWVRVTSGANTGQVRKIIGYDGTLRVAALETAWTTQSPGVGSTCSLYAKSEVAVYFDENTRKVTTSYLAAPPLSSATGGSVVPVGLADIRVGSLDATGIISLTGPLAVSSNVTIAASGILRTDMGSGSGVTFHHVLRDNAGTQKIGIGLNGVVSGGNVGADYAVCTFDNSGIYSNTPFLITRSTGNVSINTSSRVLNTLSGDGALNVAGDMTLSHPTSNMIMFKSSSSPTAPSYTTRSLGTKLILCPLLSTFSADFAFGVETQAMWASVPSDTYQFKWYSGTTSIANLKNGGLTIENNGDLTVAGFIDAGTSGALLTRVKPINSLSMPLLDTQVVQIPHGIVATKIISITCVVTASMGGNPLYVPPNRQIDGYMYSLLWTANDILIIPLEGNAVNLLGCPARVVITYQK